MIDVLDARSPRIKLYSTEASRLRDVRELLEVANYDTSFGSLSIDGLESDGLDELDLVVVEGPARAESEVLDFCRQFRERLNDRFVPLIFVTDDPGPVLRAFLSRIGTDGHVIRPVDPVVLLSQVQALLRVKFLQDRVLAQSEELRTAHKRLRLAYHQVDQELELASRIQQSMLPRELPSIPPVRFAVKFAVSGRVSGDFYDLFQVDGDTTAFYVADAMGHGVPAGLITIFVKKGIQPVAVESGSTRILSPAEVMEQLNRDLVRQDLSENPFITMCYFTLRRSALELSFARGGHPYPLLLRGNGEFEELTAEGSLLGVFETEYTTSTIQLAPGDKIIVYTDGIDSVQYGEHRAGISSFKACILDHQDLPIEELLARVYTDLFPAGRHDDDLTLLGLEIDK